MTVVDTAFAEVCKGDLRAFARWMGCVERPIRRSLRPFAQAVDVESVVQETLMRMWIFSRERGRELQGDDASLRFAIGMAKNIARNEARRLGRLEYLPPERLPDPGVAPDPPVDLGLRRAIAECLKRVAKRPLQALMARLQMGHLMRDADVAATIGMKRNTFFQNIRRAREQLAQCLEAKGVPLRELLS